KSTLYKLLSICAATVRKASVCVDYFYSDAEMGFDELNECADFLFHRKVESRDWRDDVHDKIKHMRFYLTGDYRGHTKNNSRIADHCWKYALSDPEDKAMQATCLNGIAGESHVHDLKCERCQLIKDITSLINKN
ncbi:hypothetical protein PFISCL1PPCAC_15151, partial [Pristionchus fissidentatus]